MVAIFVALHVASLIGLAVYGLLGFLTLALFLRHRRASFPLPVAINADLPVVTVQLPVYNEREVIQRLIEAVANLDYPRDRLEIQILDDSNDETTGLAAECAAYYKALGLDITLIHRTERRGFKAGALQDALALACGEFIAIFDADFVPAPDFLLQTIPHMLADPDLGAVQTRWSHLNFDDSNLTRAQAVALDKHFAIEQLVRFRADFFPKFNGSAGIWRRACISGAGGWQEDTVCEDLCLSTRAVLAGWQFHFAHEVLGPAELPTNISDYKTQQARWAMGSTQCLVKYGRGICRAKQKSITARVYALLSMSAYFTHIFLLVVLLVQLPLLLAGVRPPSALLLLGLAGLGQPILFVLAQRSLYPDWLVRLRAFPALLLIAIGMAPSNTWAILQALCRREFTFVRTPKGRRLSYHLPRGRMWIFELSLMVYSAATLLLAISMDNAGPISLLFTSFLGFGYVTLLSVREERARKKPEITLSSLKA